MSEKWVYRRSVAVSRVYRRSVAVSSDNCLSSLLRSFVTPPAESSVLPPSTRALVAADGTGHAHVKRHTMADVDEEALVDAVRAALAEKPGMGIKPLVKHLTANGWAVDSRAVRNAMDAMASSKYVPAGRAGEVPTSRKWHCQY